MAAPMSKSMSGKKRKLADLSVDEFMSGDFDSSGTESEITPSKKQTKSSKKTPKVKQSTPARQEQNKGKSKTTPMKGKSPAGKGLTPKGLPAQPKGVVSKHKASLDKLKNQDPEFFEFLQEEDASLLDLANLSGSDVTDTSDDDDASKSDDVDNPASDADSDSEIDFDSSDEEISGSKFQKFLEKKNEEEIAKKKAELQAKSGAKADVASKSKKMVAAAVIEKKPKKSEKVDKAGHEQKQAKVADKTKNVEVAEKGDVMETAGTAEKMTKKQKKKEKKKKAKLAKAQKMLEEGNAGENKEATKADPESQKVESKSETKKNKKQDKEEAKVESTKKAKNVEKESQPKKTESKQPEKKESKKQDKKKEKKEAKAKQVEEPMDDDEDDDEDEEMGSDMDEFSDDDGEDMADLSGDEEFDMDASDSDDEGGGSLHKPPTQLEVQSDNSDRDSNSEDDDEDAGMGDGDGKTDGAKVTMNMVKGWTKRFKTQPSIGLVHDVVHAFKAAVQHTATQSTATRYKVVGSKVYNAVVRMCLVEMPTALQKILGLPTSTDLQKVVLPTAKDGRWKKIKVDVRLYLSDVLALMSGLSDSTMVNVLLKHIHKLVTFYACFTKLTRAMLKKVTNVWSSGEETSRVVAFLCINRMIRINPTTMLDNCVKQMYMAYVRNSKFTSPNTLPLINFMQRSFIEVLALDYNLAYQYAFIYIRQLAIHLRNAINTKKKESCQAVYNWQYMHCIGLWSRVLSVMHTNEIMQPLVYPLVQVIIGTIKLIPTQRYYPLRFHCVQALTMLSKGTSTFIPVLPFLMEIFEQTDFNKKHKNISFKNFNFAVILKLSKAQLIEKSFKDGVIDQLYELLLEYFNAHAHTIGFPELALPAMLQLKEFLKKCKVGNFTKQIKQIVDKVDDNSKFITARRRTVNISLADNKAIDRWERDCELTGTPLNKFYNTWRKLRDRELMHQIAARDQVVDIELPSIKRPQKATQQDKKEFSALFDSDDEDDDVDLTERFLPPAEKKLLKKGKQSTTKGGKAGSEDDEDYSDLDSDDMAQLAGSADDDSDDDDAADSGDDSDGGNDDDVDDDDDDDSDDGDDVMPTGDDIVQDFTMSSDED